MSFNSAWRIRVRPFLSRAVFTTLKAVPQYTIATPQELRFPCEKNRRPLKSSFYFCSSFDDKCVSCKYIKSLLLMCSLDIQIILVAFQKPLVPQDYSK